MLHCTVKVYAKSLFLLYYTVYGKKSNKFKRLHGGVKVHCNLLFSIVYTVHGASPEDEVHGWTFWILKEKSQKSDRAVRWLSTGHTGPNDGSYGAVRRVVLHLTEEKPIDFKDL